MAHPELKNGTSITSSASRENDADLIRMVFEPYPWNPPPSSSPPLRAERRTYGVRMYDVEDQLPPIGDVPPLFSAVANGNAGYEQPIPVTIRFRRVNRRHRDAARTFIGLMFNGDPAHGHILELREDANLVPMLTLTAEGVPQAHLSLSGFNAALTPYPSYFLIPIDEAETVSTLNFLNRLTADGVSPHIARLDVYCRPYSHWE